MDNCQLGGTIQPHRLNIQPAARHVAKITCAVEWYHHRYTKNCQLSIVHCQFRHHCQLSTVHCQLLTNARCFYDPILHPHRHSLSYPHSGHSAHGQAADRGDGAGGICGDHAGGQSGGHPYAGCGHPPADRPDPDLDGAGGGAGAVLAHAVQRPFAPPVLRQAGAAH